jgi:hypothetical protein
MPDFQQQLNIPMPIEPMARGGFARFEDGELRLPVAQHVGFNPDEPGSFPNSEVELVWKLDLHHGIPGI